MELQWCALAIVLCYGSPVVFFAALLCVAPHFPSASAIFMCMFSIVAAVCSINAENPCSPVFNDAVGSGVSDDENFRCVSSIQLGLAQTFGSLPVGILFVMNNLDSAGRKMRAGAFAFMVAISGASVIVMATSYQMCLEPWQMPPHEPYAVFSLVLRVCGVVMVIGCGLWLAWQKGCSRRRCSALITSSTSILFMAPYILSRPDVRMRAAAAVFASLPCYAMTIHSLHYTRWKSHWRQLSNGDVEEVHQHQSFDVDGDDAVVVVDLCKTDDDDNDDEFDDVLNEYAQNEKMHSNIELQKLV
jgi:hypothetical protein